MTTMTMRAFIAAAASALVLAMASAQDATTTYKMCTTSDTQQSECEKIFGEIAGKSDTWSCVQGDDVMSMLESGECNVAADLDGHEVFDGSRDMGLQPVMADDYSGNGDALSYYAITVVPKTMCEENPELSLDDLKGMRSCHTGYRKTSGWTIPLATIIAGMPNGGDGNASDVGVMTGMFPTMCAPGYDGDEEGATEATCANCGGDCSKTDSEPYQGYDGALRCMMEGQGDLAFVKHSTPLDYASDGAKPEEWSTVAMDDLRILCPTGGCAELGSYESCNFAKVPSHMMAASSDLDPAAIHADLAPLNENADFQKMLADGTDLFKSGTLGLVPITVPVDEHLGQMGKIYDTLENFGYY